MLEIKNVSLKYKDKELLKDISLSLQAGKIYGLLGPNGAGKTTLYKSILNITKYTGSITCDGKEIDLKNVGSLIEYPAFYENLTIEENLKLHAQYLKIEKVDICKSLNQVDLWKYKDKKISQLSLGMKQRLGIARAFLNNGKYLLLDEPTNGLDPIGIKDFRLLLKNELSTKHNIIIISSHNLNEIVAIVDVLIFIKDGKIIEFTDNKYNDEKELEQLYEKLMGDDKEKYDD